MNSDDRAAGSPAGRFNLHPGDLLQQLEVPIDPRSKMRDLSIANAQMVEIAKALRIVGAFEEAEARGLGVVSLGSKMIDPPVVKRALRTVELACRMGILPEDWREGEGS